jgi:hypothetical protein
MSFSSEVITERNYLHSRYPLHCCQQVSSSLVHSCRCHRSASSDSPTTWPDQVVASPKYPSFLMPVELTTVVIVLVRSCHRSHRRLRLGMPNYMPRVELDALVVDYHWNLPMHWEQNGCSPQNAVAASSDTTFKYNLSM